MQSWLVAKWQMVKTDAGLTGPFWPRRGADTAMQPTGPGSISRPTGSDWAWRPPLWQDAIAVPGLSPVPAKAKLAEGTTVFHDCGRNEITLRQLPNGRASDNARFGALIEVGGFGGTYLSLAIDLPDGAIHDLKLRHVLRLETVMELERPQPVLARLNIRHGPNLEQIVQEILLSGEEGIVEFDLAASNMDEKRVRKLWIDLIFERPAMNRFFLRDLTLTRRPRAEF